MSKTPQADCISNLRSAFQQRALGLYVGAGVSLANGIPSWDELVLAMYFAAISPEPMRGWHPYPNYLLAIAEWHLNQSREPLDITARKIQRYIKTSNQFLKVLRTTLYAGYVDANGNAIQPFESHALRCANSTLDAVARLCEHSVEGSSGVTSVITDNYDELLEAALQGYPCQPFWKRSVIQPGKMPIYHVHGFVPLMGNTGSTTKEIVFTEEQYHLAAHNPYSWANLENVVSMLLRL
jgi:SIR2-like domain